MKIAFAVIILIVAFSFPSWANFAHVESISGGLSTFRTGVNHPITNSLGVEGTMETNQAWHQWYVGPSVSTQKAHVFLGLGSDSCGNRRVGGCLWASLTPKVSLLVLSNGGKSGGWDKEELSFSVSPKVSLFAVPRRTDIGSGGGIDYRLGQTEFKATVLSRNGSKPTILFATQINW